MSSRAAVMVGLMVAMFVSLIVGLSNEVKASPSTSVDLELPAESPKVEYIPGDSGIVEFICQITCNISGSEDVKAFLQVNVNIGGAIVYPESFIFNESGEHEKKVNFTVAIRVPYDTDLLPHVTVSGYFFQGGLQYEIPPVTQEIDLEPYYRFEVETPQPQEIGAGGFVEFPIKIKNIGNTEDSYRFEFLNLEDLCDDTWVIATITDKTLLANETKTVWVSAQAPRTWTLYRNDITNFNLWMISVKSEETPYVVSYNIPLFIRHKGSYIPGFSSVFAILGICLVAMFMGKRRLFFGKTPDFMAEYPKRLYSKLSMSMR